MKRFLGILLMTTALTTAAPALAQAPDNAAKAKALVASMTLDERIVLLRTQSGFGLLSLGVPLPPSVPEIMRKHTPKGALGSAGFVEAIDRVGIPAQQMSDASLGVGNLGGFLRRGDEATSLPATLALAATFDPELAQQAGDMLGAEAHAKGFNIQLAGGVNLTREPRNGRNFEYAGEDPLLAGQIVGAQVAGIQGRHVVSTLKHFALNAQETGRFVHDATIDEAALRESDLLAFEIALKRGKAGAVMCAYNKINGDYACQNDFLLNRVLKTDWAFPGWVMSDWGANHGLKSSLMAGLDQESPQDRPWFDQLKAAVESGEVPAERVDDAARRIVRAMLDTGVLDDPAKPGGAIDQAAHAAVAERVALAGMVLLKNDGLLPLAAKAHKILVVGGFADKGVLSGGGSSQVMPFGGHFSDRRGREGVAALLAPVYGLNSPVEALRKLRPDAEVTYDDGTDPARASALARAADVVLVFAVRPEEEGMDALSLSLTDGQDAVITAVAAANPRTAVVLETGNPVAMPWLSEVGAVLQAWYPGQRGGEAIAKILTGAVAPSGRLPMTFPVDVAQLPRPAIPGFDPANRKPLGVGVTVAPFEVAFTEGADVGYRWFERQSQKPLFAFGHGLTYTTFGYAGLKPQGGETLLATFTLTNTGKRAGVEVAQLYVSPPGKTHRLAGWARVALKPGERRQVTITADPRLLSSWDAKAGQWRREAGTYDLYVGKAAGSRDLPGKASLTAKTESARR